MSISFRVDSLSNGMTYNIHINNLTQNKMNLFVLSGHGSESFAAFFNGVILQKNNAAVITTAVITTHHESKLRFK